MQLLIDPEKCRLAAIRAFAETTRTIEAEARMGASPQQGEIMDVWLRSFMYNGFGMVMKDHEWVATEESNVIEGNVFVEEKESN